MSTPGGSSTRGFGALHPRFWGINRLTQAATMASVDSENGGFDSPDDSNAPVLPPQGDVTPTGGDVTPTSSELVFPTEEFNSPEQQLNSDSESQALQEPDDLESPRDIRHLFDVEASVAQQPVLDMSEVLGEMEEIGDTDSVNSSDEAKYLGEAVEEAFRDTLMLLVKDEDDVEASASPNWIMKKGIGEIRVPLPPDDWKPGVPDAGRGEPTFQNVDNPGDWPEYTFKAKFKKTTGPYLYHMPYLQAPNQSLKTLRENESLMVGSSIIKDGNRILTRNSEMELRRSTFSRKNAKAIWTTNYLRRWVIQRSELSIVIPFFSSNYFNPCVIRRRLVFRTIHVCPTTAKSRNGLLSMQLPLAFLGPTVMTTKLQVLKNWSIGTIRLLNPE